MAVREFNGTSDNLIQGLGAATGMQFGTAAMLLKFNTVTGFRSLFQLHDSSNAFVSAPLDFSNFSTFTTFYSTGSDTGFSASVGPWYLVVIRKASGTATPRYSVFNFSTSTWSHGNAASAEANGTAPGAGGRSGFAFQGTDDFFGGRVAMRGAWANSLPWTADASGDSALVAAGLHTSAANWLTSNPSVCWKYDQASTGGAVPDISASGTGTKISESGTTVINGDDPPGFSFALTSGGSSTSQQWSPGFMAGAAFPPFLSDRQIQYSADAPTSSSQATGIPSGESFGAPVAVQSVTVSPTGIASGETWGTPTRVLPSTYIVAPAAAGTHFVDQNGDPRLFVNDNVWCLLPNGGAWNSGNYQATYDTYFAQRAAQGYTAVEVVWCSMPAVSPGLVFTDGRDDDGSYPFSTNTNPSTSPNSTFWARRDYLFQSAAANGITVVMNMTTTMMNFNDPDVFQRGWTNQQWTDFGTFFGNRYKNQPNILWNCGDDYFGDFDTQFGLMRTACRAAGDTHPWSIMSYQEANSRQDIFTLQKDHLPFGVHAEYEWGYSYIQSYLVVELAQNYVPTASDDVQHQVPAIWADGFYLASGTSGGQTDDRLERQMIWWALSSGAAGVGVGDNDTWTWPSTAAAQITGKSFYTSVMPAITTAFKSLPGWHLLHPDTSSQLVTAGRGTHATAVASGGSGTPYTGNTDNYVTASRTPDSGSGSSLAVIYCAQAFNITIDQSKMTSGYTVTWIDPVNGATFAGTPGSTYNSATARGNNSAGDPDWVLVLQGTSAVTVSPTGIASAGAFGTASASAVLTASPAGVSSAEAFGTPTATAVLTAAPTAIGSAEAFGTATATAGTLTVSPAGIPSAEAFGTGSETSTLTAAPAGISSAEVFGVAAATLLLAASAVSVGTAEQFGTASATMGVLTVQPSGIASSEAFGTPVSGGGVIAAPSGIGSAEAWGTPVRTSTLTVQPTGIASGEAFGVPVVSVGTNPQPTGIPSAEQWGAAVVSTVLTAQPVGIASAEAFGAPVTALLLTASPAGIASLSAWGTPAAGLLLSASPTGIPSAESFGAAVATGGVPANLRDLSLTGKLQASRFSGALKRSRFEGGLRP